MEDTFNGIEQRARGGNPVVTSTAASSTFIWTIGQTVTTFQYQQTPADQRSQRLGLSCRQPSPCWRCPKNEHARK